MARGSAARRDLGGSGGPLYAGKPRLAVILQDDHFETDFVAVCLFTTRMVAMTSYTVTAERGSRYWVLQCVELPGALSEVTRLDQAEATIREAIAFVAEVPQDSFDLVVCPVLPTPIEDRISEARRLRLVAGEAAQAAAVEWGQVARELAEIMALRDVGRILGISPQRAQQLVNS